MDSILLTVKKALGVESDYDGFDTEIILGINTAFMSLNQLGVGTSNIFSIVGSDETWDQFIGASTSLEAVKSYICFKVRLAFDPPSSSFVMEAMNRQITELEWRLMVQVEPPPIIPVVPPEC